MGWFSVWTVTLLGTATLCLTEVRSRRIAHRHDVDGGRAMNMRFKAPESDVTAEMNKELQKQQDLENQQAMEAASEAEAMEKRMEDGATLEDSVEEASSVAEADPMDTATQIAGQLQQQEANKRDLEAGLLDGEDLGLAEGETKNKTTAKITPAKMQAIEAELSSVMSGMMTSVVSNMLTQDPKIVRLAKRQQRKEL